jgi:hypothetical protein
MGPGPFAMYDWSMDGLLIIALLIGIGFLAFRRTRRGFRPLFQETVGGPTSKPFDGSLPPKPTAQPVKFRQSRQKSSRGIRLSDFDERFPNQPSTPPIEIPKRDLAYENIEGVCDVLAALENKTSTVLVHGGGRRRQKSSCPLPKGAA